MATNQRGNIDTNRSGQNNKAFKLWCVSHLRAMLYSLGQLYRYPVGSVMTIAVIGISLTLPMAFYVFMQNAYSITKQWDGNLQITMFLKNEIDDQRAEQLANDLINRDDIRNTVFKDRHTALQEYRELSGYGEAIDMLEDNPLPSLILIQPVLEGLNEDALIQSLKAMPETELVIIDRQWIKRLLTIIKLMERSVLVLSVLLAAAVLLIVGNTIRMAINNKRDEIVITKLVGGTNAFIQRPFLYTGFWYGFLGSMMAWILIVLALQIISGPVHQLAGLYGSDYNITGVTILNALLLISIGSVLGLSGSWVSVQRHIRDIEPN